MIVALAFPAAAQVPGLQNLRIPGLTPQPTQPSQPAQSDGGKTLSQIGGCALGGLAGIAIGKKLSPADVSSRQKKGAAVASGLVGCGAGAAIAGGLYDRLSEQGRRNREQELAEAARSAQPRTYKDPQNPTFTGTVNPGPAYVDASSSRECRDIEDTLADAGKGEPVVVKYCRTPPDTRWAQA